MGFRSCFFVTQKKTMWLFARQLRAPLFSAQTVRISSRGVNRDSLTQRFTTQAAMNQASVLWSCPGCFRALGSRGVVPCIFGTCKIPHMLCSDCTFALPGRRCPSCRVPVDRVLYLGDLVPSEDEETRAKLSRLNRAPLPLGLNADRVAYIRNFVQSAVNKPLSPDKSFLLSLCVPEFELDRFDPPFDVANEERVAMLGDFYEKMQPLLFAAFEGEPYTVTIVPLGSDAKVHPAFYMKVCVRFCEEE